MCAIFAKLDFIFSFACLNFYVGRTYQPRITVCLSRMCWCLIICGSLHLLIPSFVVMFAGFVELESDALNEHECMAASTALLQHMFRHDITPSSGKAVSLMMSFLDFLSIGWISMFHGVQNLWDVHQRV